MYRLPVAALALCLVGCSATAGLPAPTNTQDATPSVEASATPTGPATATAADPCTLLTDAELTTLAGSVGEGKVVLVSGLPTCRWTTASGGFVQVVDVPATTWLATLPELLATLKESDTLGQSSEYMERLQESVDDVESGMPISATQACTLFSDLAELQGLPAGSTQSVQLIPNRDDPQMVAGQACQNGRFTTVSVADTTGFDGNPPTAQVKQALKKVLGRTS